MAIVTVYKATSYSGSDGEWIWTLTPTDKTIDSLDYTFVGVEINRDWTEYLKYINDDRFPYYKIKNTDDKVYYIENDGSLFYIKSDGSLADYDENIVEVSFLMHLSESYRFDGKEMLKTEQGVFQVVDFNESFTTSEEPLGYWYNDETEEKSYIYSTSLANYRLKNTQIKGVSYPGECADSKDETYAPFKEDKELSWEERVAWGMNKKTPIVIYNSFTDPNLDWTKYKIIDGYLYYGFDDKKPIFVGRDARLRGYSWYLSVKVNNPISVKQTSDENTDKANSYMYFSEWTASKWDGTIHIKAGDKINDLNYTPTVTITPIYRKSQLYLDYGEQKPYYTDVHESELEKLSDYEVTYYTNTQYSTSSQVAFQKDKEYLQKNGESRKMNYLDSKQTSKVHTDPNESYEASTGSCEWSDTNYAETTIEPLEKSFPFVKMKVVRQTLPFLHTVPNFTNPRLLVWVNAADQQEVGVDANIFANVELQFVQPNKISWSPGKISLTSSTGETQVIDEYSDLNLNKDDFQSSFFGSGWIQYVNSSSGVIKHFAEVSKFQCYPQRQKNDEKYYTSNISLFWGLGFYSDIAYSKESPEGSGLCLAIVYVDEDGMVITKDKSNEN